MAKYTIDYKCGHAGVEQLYGPTRDRESHVEWARGNKLCADCYREQRDKANAAASMTAAAQAKTDSLPALTGSDKQIAWAETIRMTAKAHVEYCVGQYAANLQVARLDKADLSQVPTETEMAEFGARIMRQTAAKYWIDRRSDFASTRDMAHYIGQRIREERARAAGKEMLAGGA